MQSEEKSRWIQKKNIQIQMKLIFVSNEPENDYMTDNEAELVKMFHGSIELKLTFSQFI